MYLTNFSFLKKAGLHRFGDSVNVLTSLCEHFGLFQLTP
ncbi:MAG: hypothetical protein JW390_10047 [Nitrosopumilus sp.]|nr:hypothetical protein [Candidatus Nitrosopumilus limneticus]